MSANIDELMHLLNTSPQELIKEKSHTQEQINIDKEQPPVENKATEPPEAPKEKPKHLHLLVIAFVLIGIVVSFFIMVFLNSFFEHIAIIPAITVTGLIPVLIKLLKEKYHKEERKHIIPEHIQQSILICLVISIIIGGSFVCSPKIRLYALEQIKSSVDTISKSLEMSIISLKENSAVWQANSDNEKGFVNFVLNDEIPSDSQILAVSNNALLWDYGSQANTIESKLKHDYLSSQAKAHKLDNPSYQRDEDKFLYDIDEAKNIYDEKGYCEKWLETLPNENQLLEIISSQQTEALSAPSFDVFNKISNNYQRLAKEYIFQEKDKSKIKYYFYISAYYDYLSIQYASNQREFNTAVSRFYCRMSDIIYCNCPLTDTERNRIEYLKSELQQYSKYY